MMKSGFNGKHGYGTNCIVSSDVKEKLTLVGVICYICSKSSPAMESEQKIYQKIEQRCERTIYAIADGIGFCVAEIRFSVFPTLRKAANSIKSKATSNSGNKSRVCSVDKTDPVLSLHTDETPPKVVKVAVEASGTIFQPQSTIPLKVLKKYNYWWALARIERLKKSGMSDPVGYFNNEMSDWWLAPGGMMENDADFEGIARAIEEHWE